MNEKSSCITINCGCCSNGCSGNETGDCTPVGTVISYIGTKAPEKYLICDGSEYDIELYPELVKQMIKEFGKVNYFGGDGAITFAVPDLRNEFLRGYHGDTLNKLSNEVGIHQEATLFPYMGAAKDSKIPCFLCSILEGQGNVPTNSDTMLERKGYITCIPENGIQESTNIYGSFSSRPTNVSVLYCIKY